MKSKILLPALALSLAINAWFYWSYATEAKQHQFWQAQSEKTNAELIDFAAKVKQEADRITELTQEIANIRKSVADFQSASKYEYLGEFTVTAYCCEKRPHICGEGHGITSSGLPVQPGMCAVDESVIPLGSTVYVDGIPYLAADTGGKIKGNKVDIVKLTHQEAEAYALQKHEVWIVRK